MLVLLRTFRDRLLVLLRTFPLVLLRTIFDRLLVLLRTFTRATWKRRLYY